MSNSNTLSPRASALLAEIRESGSVITSRNDHAALGELVTAGYKIRGAYARDTKIAGMDALRAKGFDEWTCERPHAPRAIVLDAASNGR